jgi:hypothetical protein
LEPEFENFLKERAAFAPKRSTDNNLFAYLLSWFTDPIESGPYGKHHPMVGAHETFAGTTPGTAKDLSDWESIL